MQLAEILQAPRLRLTIETSLWLLLRSSVLDRVERRLNDINGALREVLGSRLLLRSQHITQIV